MLYLFVDISEDFWHLYAFFFSCGMSNTSIGVTSSSYFIYSIKDMPNIKHQNSFKVDKS